MTIARSFAFSLLQNYGTTVIAFVSSMFIARILTPDEIGVFSLGAAFIAISHAFRDFGVSSYVVQERELTDEKVAAALRIAFVISWLIAILVFLAGFLAHRLYQDERVEQVLHLLAVNFLLLPLSSVGMALLRRAMSFGKICIINIVAALLQAVVSVFFALQGFSYLSLVAGAIVSTVATVLLTLYFVSMRRFMATTLSAVKSVIRKTGSLSANSVLYEFGVAFPEMVIGKAIGFSAVSYFSKALSTLDVVDKIVLGALRPILLPYLSEISRQRKIEDSDVNNLLSFPLAVTWPLLLFIAVNADMIILFLFGEQWGEAAALVPVLCVAAAIKNIISVTSPIIIANGDYKMALRYQVINQVFRIVAILIGASFSLVGVCIAVVVSEVFAASWIMRFITKAYDLSARLLLITLFKLFLMQLALILLAVVFYSQIAQLSMGAFFDILIFSVLFTLLWLIMLRLTNSPVYPFLSKWAYKLIVMPIRRVL